MRLLITVWESKLHKKVIFFKIQKIPISSIYFALKFSRKVLTKEVFVDKITILLNEVMETFIMLTKSLSVCRLLNISLYKNIKAEISFSVGKIRIHRVEM